MLTNVIIESMANRRVLVTTNEFCFNIPNMEGLTAKLIKQITEEQLPNFTVKVEEQVVFKNWFVECMMKI